MVISKNTLLERNHKVKKATKRELVNKTLDEDFPGLDYLGFHNVLVAKKRWYCYLWFILLFLCVIGGITTTVLVIKEYVENPQVTRVQVKAVDTLALPFVSICPTEPIVDVSRFDNYLRINFPNLFNNSTVDARKMAIYIIAGSGFQKQNIRSLGNLSEYSVLYDTIRGSMNITRFFQLFFDEFGPSCSDLFESCSVSSRPVNCCTIFKPFYAIRRGRCFRQYVSQSQTTFDEQGKMKIHLKTLKNINGENATELIAFLGDERKEIAPFPRYYLYPSTIVRLQVKAAQMKLLPAEGVCSTESGRLGKSTCFLNYWFATYLEKPFNCTYPYMERVRPTGLPSCHPSVVVANYDATVENPHYNRHECSLPCDRWDYSTTMERIQTRSAPFDFRVDVLYTDLQYEEFTTLNTVTFMGLLAQIGGQLALFLGSSILSFAQLAILSVVVSKRIAIHMYSKSSVTPTGTNEMSPAVNTIQNALEMVDNVPEKTPFKPILKFENQSICRF